MGAAMISCAFRFLDLNGDVVGWYGFAFAQNKRELFWQIDEHGDPYRCEVKQLRRGSVCFLQVEDDIMDYELGEVAILDDKKWKKPNWDGIHG
jgi:hypothetical protein